ncbi:MAG: cysteine synthase A [Bdellovibrionales bacterium]
MDKNKFESIIDLIGNTPVLKIKSLSEFTGCNIFLKLEHLNPGGSVKDRAALQMVKDALETGKLNQNKTIIEGTAGNTGIGLALVGNALGIPVEIVMPNNQSPEKSKMIELFGAKLRLVQPVPFKDPKHFYHQAKSIASHCPDDYWWADQFENTSNFKAHYQNTGPEIYKQLPDLSHFVSTSGSGGTLAGVSKYLKEQSSNIQSVLIDPKGSGLKSFVEKGEFQSEGSSFTEGIGIMRLVNNFKNAEIDKAISLEDRFLVAIAHTVKELDGIILGLSSALNVAGAFYTALHAPKSSTIVTISCDLGERSIGKLYNPEFLKSKEIEYGSWDLKRLEKEIKSFPQ